MVTYDQMAVGEKLEVAHIETDGSISAWYHAYIIAVTHKQYLVEFIDGRKCAISRLNPPRYWRKL